jgi:hypothetical protein
MRQALAGTQMSDEDRIDLAAAVSVLIVGLGLTDTEKASETARARLAELCASGVVRAWYRSADGRWWPLASTFWKARDSKGRLINDLTLDAGELEKRWEARKAKLIAAGESAVEVDLSPGLDGVVTAEGLAMPLKKAEVPFDRVWAPRAEWHARLLFSAEQLRRSIESAWSATRAPRRARHSKIRATEAVLRDLYPDGHPPRLLKTITQEINARLKRDGAPEVSEDTVSRALKLLQQKPQMPQD